MLAMSVAMSHATDPTEVSEWFPMTPGDRWVYEMEIRGGDQSHPTIERVEERYEVISRSAALIVRSAMNSKGDHRESDISVRNHCIYFLDRQRPELPDFCFPLSPGKTWGDPDKLRDHWTVAGYGKKHADDPASIKEKDWRLEAHLASGEDNYVWFRKGVGVVAERTWHNGTYDDRTARLVRFTGH
jgi:hypothetical protein